MASVLAISGLHIGLLYFGLFGVTRLIATMKPSVWENESFVAISRWFPLLLLWGYVFLLEFPNPAQRAVTMITLWLLFRELDYRLPSPLCPLGESFIVFGVRLETVADRLIPTLLCGRSFLGGIESFTNF